MPFEELVSFKTVSISVAWYAPKDIKILYPGNKLPGPTDRICQDIRFFSDSWFSQAWPEQFFENENLESNLLVSALVTLACSRPAAIRQIFCLENEVSEHRGQSQYEVSRKLRDPCDYFDRYKVRIWNDRWIFMDLDCTLPCRMNGQLLSSSSISSNTLFLWLSFVEKALAAVFGGYGSISLLSFETVIRQIRMFRPTPQNNSPLCDFQSSDWRICHNHRFNT